MNARIEELVLRIPGITRAEAGPLAEEVMDRVRRGLPARFQAVALSALKVRLALPLGLPREALAERIARAVLDQLRPGGAS